MLLGNLVRRLTDEQEAAAALQSLGDLALFARVAEMAHAFKENPGDYVAASVGRFAASAGDETWLQLIGEAERAHDPGSAALRRMLLWALSEDERGGASTDASVPSCGCGKGGDARHGEG
jgi:hypothetical protein